MDFITVLRSKGIPQTKTWHPDGSITVAETMPRWYTHERIEVADLRALGDALDALQRDSTVCVIRGGLSAEAGDGPTYERRAYAFNEVPHHWMLVDVDGYEVLGVDPVADPREAIEEFIAAMLPAPFATAPFWWQLSASMGKVPQLLKAHLWFWLREPATGAQLTAWAQDAGLARPKLGPKGEVIRAGNGAVDVAVFRKVQAHYVAAPVVLAGAECPVKVRSGAAYDRGGGLLVLNLKDPMEVGPRALPSTLPAPVAPLEDKVLGALYERAMVLKDRPDGGYNIICPYRGGHTTQTVDPNADSSTIYYGAGCGPTKASSWSIICLHASCTGRAHVEWEQALGLVLDDFDVIPPAVGVPRGIEAVADRLRRNGKGLLESSLRNAIVAVNHPCAIGTAMAVDQFRDQMLVARWPDGRAYDPEHGLNGAYRELGWGLFTDSDYSRVHVSLENLGFVGQAKLGKPMVRDAVMAVAGSNAFDSGLLWASNLVWDGKKRMDRFLTDYMGAQDTRYTRAVSRYIWTALAARTLDPGHKCDMMVILVSDEGQKKSSALRAMVEYEWNFYEGTLKNSDQELAKAMRGVQLVEVAELRGFRSRERADTLAFLSRQVEKFRPLYQEFTREFPRRCIFIATTNEEDFMDGAHRDRRLLPVRIFGYARIDEIQRDRQQLWAEGVEWFRAHGLAYGEAEQLGAAEHAQFVEDDLWDQEVHTFLQERLEARGESPDAGVRLAEVLRHAIGGNVQMDKKSEIRLSKIMKRFGWARGRDNRGGRLWLPAGYAMV